MTFENLYIIFFLWLTPVLILFFMYSYKRRNALLEKFCTPEICQKIIDGFNRRRKIVKYVLMTLVFVLLIITLAKPQWGFVWEDVHRKGVDIYVAIDVSKSMLAEDMDPNRLERAKRELIDFLDILKGDRVGLIIFAGASFIQCPLTLDYNAIQMFIDEITPESLPVKGTSISSAIKTSIDAFNRSAESSSKAIILITDGEDHMGSVIDMAKEAKRQNIVIYAIGMGKEEGALIPSFNGHMNDALGNPIKSKPDFKQLKEIAKITGGVYTNSVTGNLDIENIYLKGIKKTLKESDLGTSRAKKMIERFQWPLSLALLLLLVEYFLSDRKRSKSSKIKEKVIKK